MEPKNKCIIVIFCIAFLLAATFLAGFWLGYIAHPRPILKNADLNMYSGGEVANITLTHCRVIADRTALDVSVHDCEFIDPPDGPEIAER